MREIDDLQSFRNELLLGKAPSEGSLKTLALAAILGKFEHRGKQKFSANPYLNLRPARYPNDITRRALRGLLSGRDGNVSDIMATSVPAVLRQHGLSLHPFDFSALENFVAEHREQLSQDARDWIQLVRPGQREADDLYFDGPISEDHLMLASKAQRVQYLKELRAKNPQHARTLIESLLPTEAAEMRLRLLKILGDKPTIDDQDLIESLLKDRAPTVKDFALVLLGRIPGTETFTRQVERLRDSLQIKTEGLLRRRKVFVFKGPDPKPGQNRFSGLLESLSLDEFAKAFGEAPASIIPIVMSSDKLLDLQLGLVRKAVDEKQISLIKDAAAQLNGHDGMLMAALIDDDFAERAEQQRAEILGLCFTPAIWKQLPHLNIFMQAAARIPPSLPERMARDLISHACWVKNTDDTKKLYLESIAHLIPHQHSVAFSQLADGVAPRAAHYHRFISSLT
jgi:hypothetical protein